MSGLCTRNPRAGDLVVGPCPNCQHATLLHPSSANPTLPACIACLVDDHMTKLAAYFDTNTLRQALGHNEEDAIATWTRLP